MPILQSLGIKGYGLTSSKASTGITYIGGVVVNSATNTTYPSGTQNGDLVVVVSHNASGSTTTPSGFTSAFTTGGNQYGYAKNVSYKIVSGDTAVTPGAGGGYDSTILTFRGASTVSSTAYSYSDVNSGSSININATATGIAVIIASDRGASGYPTIGSYSNLLQGTATYFYQSTGIKTAYISGTSVSITDYNDVYGTSGLIFVVQ